MRVIGLFFVALVGLSGCGSVSAKQQDAGTSDAAPDAKTSLCTANARSCGTDNALYECSADGDSLTKLQDCQYGCATDHCKQCAANTTFCDGGDLVMCSSDGMITNPQQCVHGCQMDRCNTCDPGANFCDTSGNAVTCGQNGMPSNTMSCGAAGCAGGVCNQCAPNTTTCQGDTLVVCNAGGTVASTTTCALGCSTTGTVHCKSLVPSYGVGAPSGTLPNLVVDMNGTLDISNCSGSPSSVTLTLGSTSTSIVGSPQVAVATQSGGPPICVVRFGTINVMSGMTLTIVNSASPGHALSLQATGDFDINGTISFVDSQTGPAPGASVVSTGTNSNNKTCAPGAGGGGAAFAGGTGGTCFMCTGSFDVAGGAGGAAIQTITTKLTGGSVGGSVTNGGSTTYGFAGRGGGALHLVSLTHVSVGATGVVSVNGTGGRGVGGGSTIWNLPAGGAGSGGSVVVEAPVVSVSTGGISTANGGGGAGGCALCDSSSGFPMCGHYNGQNGQLSMNIAAGGYCANYLTGHGGGENTAAGGADGVNSDAACSATAGGGGGGGRGFMIMRGRTSSSVMLATGSIVSPMPTLGAVTAN